MEEDDFEGQGQGAVSFTPAPDSELNNNVKMGRPRDTRYDAVVRKAYEEGVAQRTVVSEDEVDDVVRGLKRGGKHVGVSVSLSVFEVEDDPSSRIVEFIAYETHRRDRGGE